MKKGIHVCAWSPLGAYKVFWGSNAVIENPTLQEIAQARKKSVAQVQLISYFKLFSIKTLNYLVLNKLL